MEARQNFQARTDCDLDMVVAVEMVRISCILGDLAGELEICQEIITRMQEANYVC